MRLAFLLVGLSLGFASPLSAQAQPKPSPSADPALLKIARETVTQMQGDRVTVMNSMAAPMVGLVQQMGIKEPDRANVLIQEVVLPTLSSHYDELLDVLAKSYASALGKDDLQAISAFYSSPTGKHLIAVQPQLAQAQLSGMQQWMVSVMPDMQAKIAKAVQAHGWGAGGQGKPR